MKPPKIVPAKVMCGAMTALAIVATQIATVRAELTHRYSFASDASDSVGTAHGTLQGNAVVEFGAVSLDGTAGTYVDLPSRLITGYTAVTFEAWATMYNNGAWTRLFDFGGISGANGRDYIFFAPRSGTPDSRLVISDADPGYNHEEMVTTPTLTDDGSALHIVGVLDPARNWGALYINGVLVSSNPNITIPLSEVDAASCFLGRSLYSADPYMVGSIDEFRVHNSALNSAEVAASYASGPDTPDYSPGTLTDLSISLLPQYRVGARLTPTLKATYSKVGEIVLGLADVTLSSSKPDVVEVAANKVMIARSPGTTTITAAIDGKTATADVTVVPAPATLVNRYSFNEPAGSTEVVDSVSGQNGMCYPDQSGTRTIGLGTGQAVFPGGASYTESPYIDLPDYLISNRTNLTIEVWATWTEPTDSSWSRIFDIGSSTKGDNPHNSGGGTSSFWLSPRSGGGVLRFDAWNGTTGYTLAGTSAMPKNRECHIVCTYAPDYGVSELWLNGVRLATMPADFALSSLNDANVWLGLSQWDDPPFQGSINEFRIYEGALSEIDIALRRQAGPDKLPSDPGLLQSLAASAPALLLGNPAGSQAAVLANFQNTPNVDVTALSSTSLKSTDPGVFTVAAGGLLRPVAVGTASLVATYGGLSATTSVSVLAPTSLTLVAPSSLYAGGPLANAVLTAQYAGTNANVAGFNGVTFSSDKPAVASVNNTGGILPLRAGTAVITATYGGLTANATIEVTMAPTHQQATLIHRYSFSEAPGTAVVNDLVGTAHGELRNPGNGSDFTGAGRLVLAGGAWDAVPEPAYVNLPNGLVSSLTSVSIEGWVRWAGGGSWQRIFDFGRNSSETEDVYANPGQSYMFLCPLSGAGTFRFAIKQGTGPEQPVLDSAPLPTGQDVHFVLVYDTAAGAARLYRDGQRVATGPIVLPLSVVEDLNVYLGRSQWTDPVFAGEFDEFRIYSGSLTEDQVAMTFAAGPNTVPDLTPAPALTANLSAGNLELRWPAAATGFVLESSPALGTGANWQAVSQSPQTEGSNLKVVLPTTGTASYYRLRK